MDHSGLSFRIKRYSVWHSAFGRNRKDFDRLRNLRFREILPVKLTDKILIWFIERSKMFNDIKKWFIGNESKKRYMVAAYVGARAIAAYFSHPFPVVADQIAAALGIWAAADAAKKLEPK